MVRRDFFSLLWGVWPSSGLAFYVEHSGIGVLSQAVVTFAALVRHAVACRFGIAHFVQLR
jgi:hypothetical protein